MRFRRPKLRWIAVSGILTVGLLLCYALHCVSQVAALQDCLERDWEIAFNAEQTALPPRMPAWCDSLAKSLIDRALPTQRGQRFSGEKVGKENREIVWRERIRSIFRGPITEIEIYAPGRMCDDLGAA